VASGNLTHTKRASLSLHAKPLAAINWGYFWGCIEKHKVCNQAMVRLSACSSVVVVSMTVCCALNHLDVDLLIAVSRLPTGI